MLDLPSGYAWHSGFESNQENYRKEIFLRVAAYKATHGGQPPPRNSLLWSELARLKDWPRRHFRLFGRLRRDPEDRGWARGRPLRPYLVERSFLADDFTEASVEERLEAWPMVTAYRPEGRVFTGEWFTYTMEVRAESRRQAQRIVDCIFSLPAPQAAGTSEEEAG